MSFQHESVLLVDDEVTLSKNIVRFLARAGCDVVATRSIAEAKDVLDHCDIKAICLDLNLPDGNGLDFLCEIRQSEPDLPTIVITGVATQEIKSRAFRLGAQELLEKPFSLVVLKEALQRALTVWK